MLGETVTVKIDRPIGSTHPCYPNTIYPINYGFVEGVFAPDGEEQDAYILGIDTPIDTFTGKVIAIIHRKNDIEDKWVVASANKKYTAEQIKEITHFQEKYYDIEIIN